MPSLWQPDPINERMLRSKIVGLLWTYGAKHGIMFNRGEDGWRTYRIGPAGQFDPNSVITTGGGTVPGSLARACCNYPELNTVAVKMILLAFSLEWLLEELDKYERKIRR